MGRIFGTDGVRGLANVDLTPEFAMALGRALVWVLLDEGHERPSIVVGRDPRWSSPMLVAALSAGIASAGGDVIDLGVVPTPAVAHLTLTLDHDAGAMVSASHNPMPDNGIKFFGHDGFKLTDVEEQRLEAVLSGDLGDGPRPTATDVGSLGDGRHLVAGWVDHLVATGGDLSGLKVVVDAANGSASAVAPVVYERLGAEVVAIHAAPDGININAGCGSTHPEDICRAVVELGADVGIAHDGDADRLIAVDHRGNEVDGDVILAILASHAHRNGGLPGAAVVTTVMTNLGFRQAMQAQGIEVVETAVGDRYVLAAMRERGLVLGGEPSGHLIALDHATTGDGILSAVALLTTVAESRIPLAELATVMSRLPQVLVNVSGVDRDRFADAANVEERIREVEATLGDQGRVLVRPSGTEPLIRVMVEAPTAGAAQQAADHIADAVRESLSLD